MPRNAVASSLCVSLYEVPVSVVLRLVVRLSYPHPDGLLREQAGIERGCSPALNQVWKSCRSSFLVLDHMWLLVILGLHAIILSSLTSILKSEKDGDSKRKPGVTRSRSGRPFRTRRRQYKFEVPGRRDGKGHVHLSVVDQRATLGNSLEETDDRSVY